MVKDEDEEAAAVLKYILFSKMSQCNDVTIYDVINCMHFFSYLILKGLGGGGHFDQPSGFFLDNSETGRVFSVKF